MVIGAERELRRVQRRRGPDSLRETPRRSLCREGQATLAMQLSVIIEACQMWQLRRGTKLDQLYTAGRSNQLERHSTVHGSASAAAHTGVHADVLPISLPALDSPEGQPPPPAWLKFASNRTSQPTRRHARPGCALLQARGVMSAGCLLL